MRPEKESAYKQLGQETQELKTIGKAVGGAASLAIGGSAILPRLTPHLAKLVPFLNRALPVDLAVKGIQKLDPGVGKFINEILGDGYSVEDGLDFIRGKLGLNEQQPQQQQPQAQAQQQPQVQQQNQQGAPKPPKSKDELNQIVESIKDKPPISLGQAEQQFDLNFDDANYVLDMVARKRQFGSPQQQGNVGPGQQQLMNIMQQVGPLLEKLGK